jgi:release factor glutamine methyltransferase
LTNTEKVINQQEYRLLLGKVLQKSPEWIFMHLPQLSLTIDEKQKLNELINRRLKGEPIAKILGFKEFYGRNFFTNKHTLDPRPDSETIIDAVKKYFSKDTCPQILDLGTGTGCLFFSILAEFPNAFGIGIDYSWSALKVAQRNQEYLNLKQRSLLLQGDWTKSLQGKFDIILCNPPYISTHEKLDVSTLHDPNTALFSGLTGLEDYQKILPSIPSLLKSNGLIFLEIGKNQEKCVQNIASTADLIQESTFTDLSGIVRVLCYSAKKR